jgi:hypothetical protein
VSPSVGPATGMQEARVVKGILVEGIGRPRGEGSMTEAEWKACINPKPMLRALQGKVSERKLRLFAWACCRHVWPLLTHDASRRAVEVLGLYADGLADHGQLAAAAQAAHDLLREWKDGDRSAASAAANAVDCDAAHPSDENDRDPEDDELFPRNVLKNAVDAALAAAWAAGHAVSAEADDAWMAAVRAEETWQCLLVRDVFGNPFRRPRSVHSPDPALQDNTVRGLTLALYQGHDEFPGAQLGLLADALEDAGCTDADLLGHLRAPGLHYRGCWALDQVLGLA